ncbi:MAG: TadE family protein [Myxococcaceae bacterium]|nr:TadE family protein [Myxococcaceae bacterium]
MAADVEGVENVVIMLQRPRIGQVAAPLDPGPVSRDNGRMTHARSRRGQVAVETAIVLPVFVFLILGLLQLGLMHHARIMAKYAAYKAVRAGSLNRGERDAMEKAALAVMLPVLGRKSDVGAPFKTDSATAWNQAWNQMKNNDQASGVKWVDVQVCNPSRNALPQDGDFDDPRVATQSMGGWYGFNSTKLQVQVTAYYRMYIPFANWMVWRIAANKEDGSPQKMRWLGWKANSHTGTGAALAPLANLANQKKYIVPIRTSYAMRMQSSFSRAGYQNLPNDGNGSGTSRNCKVNWR